MDVEIRAGRVADAGASAALNELWQRRAGGPDQAEGFINYPFSTDQLAGVIAANDCVVASIDGEAIGYYLINTTSETPRSSASSFSSIGWRPASPTPEARDQEAVASR